MQMNNDNYLQDFYNYNHMPNNYNPYMNNPYYQNGMPNMPNAMQQGQLFMQNGMNRNPNMYEQNNTVNLTNFYPSIYRIINPVVGRVVQNSNYQMLNEDTINNMVDTVFSIVDGQIDYMQETPAQNVQNNQAASTGNSSQNANMQGQRQTNSEINNQRNNANIQCNKKSDELLRDIIRILIIKELLARRNNQYVTY